MTPELPTLARLRERFRSPGENLPELRGICRLDNPSGDAEAEVIIQYLHALGARTSTLKELLDGIAGLEDEEELSAFECREGVAVTHASDGWWLLFVDGDA
ncbi:hypothetical protein [Caulobacter sp. BP25]|uniref:hypothetical protein n=1 Tax=Caulobacter sp. BP25 TaxID=2048900 RepID=UPI000C12B96B|nr:hypothetical protein [Caulobacter sp. BP25]PHY22394.1 hypothetical protein CSW59_02965 [Caulobacter sp. BP25]